MEQQIQKSTGSGTTDEEVCDLCRITYSIYSNFPPMPSAQALNVETGEFFPFDTVRKMKSGYDMAEALGYARACTCRGRSPGCFDQQFELKDTGGNALADAYYTARLPSGELVQGITDSQGRTARHRTRGAQSIHIYLGHRGRNA